MNNATWYILIMVATYVTSLPSRNSTQSECEQDAEAGRSHLLHHLHVTDYDVNMNCTNGSLVWNYPTGGIRLHFSSPDNTKFEVCLKNGLLANNMNFFNETGGTHDSLPSFSYSDPERKICVQSRDSEVQVLMEAPTMGYIAALDYFIELLS